MLLRPVDASAFCSIMELAEPLKLSCADADNVPMQATMAKRMMFRVTTVIFDFENVTYKVTKNRSKNFI